VIIPLVIILSTFFDETPAPFSFSSSSSFHPFFALQFDVGEKLSFFTFETA
jgi:hypothetical protein